MSLLRLSAISSDPLWTEALFANHVPELFTFLVDVGLAFKEFTKEEGHGSMISNLQLQETTHYAKE